MIVTGKIKICTYLHFSTSEVLPYYIKIYVGEISKFFDKVYFISNNTILTKQNSALPDNIEIVYFENKGYDFGLFYRFIKNENLDNFSQIAIVNDSNILLNNLDNAFQIAEKTEADVWGMIDSNEKPWFSTHADNYHLQSHFIVLNEKAILLLPEFFIKTDIDTLMNVADQAKLRRLVIDKWEIGLSQFFIEKGLKLYAVFSSQEILSKHNSKKRNVANELYYELAAEKYPMLKKKVVLNKKPLFSRKSPEWEKTINDFLKPEWDAQLIIEELQNWGKQQKTKR